LPRALSFYLVAGEASGDALGAGLMAALRTLRAEATFAGLGGPRMAAEGLEPLFDIADLDVMGLVEVVPRLRTLRRRIRATVADVLGRRPDALVTIDSPGFGLRVAQRVRAADPGIRTIHYVAPSVWAWRPGRARHMAAYVDHVLALLPFEPPFMEAAGMTCDFVGHPAAARPPVPEAEVAAARARLGAEGRPLLLLAPGSRRGEVGRLGPVFAEAAARLAAGRPDLAVAIPVAPGVRAEVASLAQEMGIRAALIPPETSRAERRAAFAAADAALVASGTITLEMAAAHTPHVAAYRTSAITAAIVRRLLRVDTANLVNLVAGGRPVPEFIQERCEPGPIAGALDPLLQGGPARRAQLAAYRATLAALGRHGEAPAFRAARSVLARLR
jgi:lipid-A-disaccharide synthase